MNYLDYKEIMEAEGLILPKVGEYTLERAKRCQRLIKRMKINGAHDQVKKVEEEKIYWIWSAIEWARLAKENPAVFNWGEELLKRMEIK